MNKKLITAGICLIILAFCFFEAYGGICDFNIYLQASTDLFTGTDIYAKHYVDGYHYYYSLFFALLIYPFTYLPTPLPQFLWLTFNAFFLYRIVKIIAEYFDISTFSRKQKAFFLIACLAFSFEFILSNFRSEQVTICILYLTLEGLRFIFSGKQLPGAALIALGINIKIMPIVMVPYLIYRRKLKAATFIVTAYAILLILPFPFIGIHHSNELLASWWNLINPANKQHVLDVDERSFHSLSTLLATLLVENIPDKYALPIKRNIANISPVQLTYVLNVVRFMLIVFALYFFRTKPFTVVKNNLHRLWEISYLLLLVPLIFPHQQVYAFLFAIPAACYVLYYLVTERAAISITKYRFLLTGCILVYLTFNIRFLLGQFNQYYEHFKVLTYGALLLILILAMCVPKQAVIQVEQT